MDSLFAGCGYVGRQVALRELVDGGAVAAIVRTAESAERLNREGIAAVSADLENEGTCTGVLRGRVLYWFVPPQPCLLYTSPSPRDRTRSRMPSSA